MGPSKEISTTFDDSEKAEMTYFFDILDQFIEILKKNTIQTDNQVDPENKTLTLVARSPQSCIAKAITKYSDDLKSHNVKLHIIFSQLTQSEELNSWLSAQTSPCGLTPQHQIRWAKRANLADAHEQLTLGSLCSWSGESMRRDINARFGFYIFNNECKQTALMSQRSFTSLWKMSQTIPQSYFKRTSLLKNSDYLNLQNETAGLSVNTNHLIAPEFTRH